MTFEALEYSEDSGNPLFLYRFTIGSTRHQYVAGQTEYTNSLAGTFTPLAIDNKGLSDTTEVLDSRIQITLPKTSTLIPILKAASNVPISVDVFKVHRDDPDEEIRLIWPGRVVERGRSRDEYIITCEPLTTFMSRSGIRAKNTRSCRYVLYGAGCFASQSTFTITGTATAQSGSIMTIQELSGVTELEYTGGILIHSSGQQRFIIRQVNDQLHLTQPILNFNANDTVTIAKGCDRSIEICNSRFNNVTNFGGQPYIPVRDVTGQTTIY